MRIFEYGYMEALEQRTREKCEDLVEKIKVKVEEFFKNNFDLIKFTRFEVEPIVLCDYKALSCECWFKVKVSGVGPDGSVAFTLIVDEYGNGVLLAYPLGERVVLIYPITHWEIKRPKEGYVLVPKDLL